MKSIKFLAAMMAIACTSNMAFAQNTEEKGGLVKPSKQNSPENNVNQNRVINGTTQNNVNVDRQMNQANNMHHAQSADHQIAQCLTIENQAEIKMAQFAKSHTKNDQVRKFTEMLAQDHQKFVQKLEQFASNTNAAHQHNATNMNKNNTTTTTVNGNVNAQNQQVNGTVATEQPRMNNQNVNNQNMADGHHGQHGINPIQLHREMADQCYSDSVAMLNEKPEKFDKCFVGMQIAGHAHMISQLKVLKNHASPELAQVLEEGLQTTKQHMEAAEQLMEQIANEHASK